jgi:hypothetical protein
MEPTKPKVDTTKLTNPKPVVRCECCDVIIYNNRYEGLCKQCFNNLKVFDF